MVSYNAFWEKELKDKVRGDGVGGWKTRMELVARRESGNKHLNKQKLW